MPRLVAAARLHRRQNAHYARMIPAFLQHFLGPILLPETFSAPYKFDLHGIIGREALHVLPKRLAHSLGPLGVVEDSDLVLVKVMPWMQSASCTGSPIITARQRDHSG